MTLAERIASLEKQITGRLAARETKTGELNALRDQFDAGDQGVTEDAVKAILESRGGIDAELRALHDQHEALKAELAQDEAVARLQGEIHPGGQPSRSQLPAYDEVIRTGNTTEARTYTRETAAAKGLSFFTDAYRAQFTQDLVARDRVERHQREVMVENELTAQQRFMAGEQQRSTGTAAYAGLIIPQYLIDLAAPVIRFGRPLANAIGSRPLPETGMSLIIPRMTTGSATAIQTAENATLTTQDQAWSNLTVPVCTIGGYADTSRQSLERGVGIDAIIYGDLARAYAANLDNQVINGTGSAGQFTGILNTGSINAATAFGAVPTITNYNLKVSGQVAAITGVGAGIQPKIIVQAPRRWGWYTAQMDSAGRPVVLADAMGPFNAGGVISTPGTYGGDIDPIKGLTFQGKHSSGLPVLTDANIPINVGTNVEDVSLVLDTDLIYLWEDGDGLPKELRFEQPVGNALTTRLVAYNYAAFTAGRYPGAVGKIGGLDSTATFGLVAPTF